ncbi:integrase, catalytic region, zinc finger, CCHC-type containing protein [Tanacetum coccineum]
MTHQKYNLKTVEYDELYDHLYQFEPHVNASKAKKAARNHDPLALVANSYAHSSHSHASPSYSHSPQSYCVTHPLLMIDNDYDYQREIQGIAQEDKLTTTMMLLARAITQHYSTPTNNYLHTSSNTRNQAVIQDVHVDIQRKNVVYTGNGNMNVGRQNSFQATNAGNGKTNVQCYNCNGKGYNARECPKPRVRDAKYFRDQMLLALKDEAEAHLDEEKNDFMLDNAYRDNTLEELHAIVIMMVNASQVDMINGLLSKNDHEQRHHEKQETIIHTSTDDQIDSDVIFDDPYMDNNSGQAEHDTNAHDQSLHDFESLIINVQVEAKKQHKMNIELKKQKALLQRELETTSFGFHPFQFSYPPRKLTMEEMLYKVINEGRREHEEMGVFIREFKTTSELLLKERNNSLRELEFEVFRLSNAINNAQLSNYEVKGVTTRGGKTTTEIIRDTNDINKEPPILHHDKPVEPNEVLVKERIGNLKKLHINIPFTEALSQMPKCAKFLKGLLSNKTRLEEACTVTMNERCLAVLLNKLLSKEKDPGSFTISCDIGHLHINNALADLGAIISLMPYMMYEKLCNTRDLIRRITCGYPWPELEGKRFGIGLFVLLYFSPTRKKSRWGTLLSNWDLCVIRSHEREPLMEIEGDRIVDHLLDAVDLLIPLSRGSFDVIVGTDWLSKRKFVIVCHEKVVRIPIKEGGILRVHGERTLGAAKALMNAKVDEPKLSDISVVQDFVDVFPEDLSGLPPQ